MNTPDLSIVIVNWKSQAFVRQCLRSLAQNCGVLDLEVIVIDNASFDGCGEMLREEFPEAIFVQSEKNLGFASANNQAFRQSRGRHILFLNPDTEVREGALERMLAVLSSHPDAGLVGAHLLNTDLTTQTTCVAAIPTILNQTLNSDYLRRTFPRWKMWGMTALLTGDPQPSRVEAISGACMLGRREAIEHVGAFSTRYFMYAEDMDLCVKVARAGWEIYYVPEALIVHHGGRSSSSRESNFSNIVLRQSLVCFLQTHRGPFYTALYRLSVTLVSAVRLVLLIVASPVLVARRNFDFLRRAVGKWVSILMWSIGLLSGAQQASQSK